MKNNLAEIVLVALTAVIAFLVLDPLGWWMPGMLAMLLLAALFILVCAYAVFVLRERAEDEREEAHRAAAGRAAFLAGSLVLLVGIIVEDLAHALDPWLVWALVGMLAAKALMRAYADERF
jgi:hypothetical protein